MLKGRPNDKYIMTIYHMHHIVPKHMGGTDDESNLVKLTVTEHAEAHRLLYEEHGSKFDWIAYLALSNQIGKEEANYLKLLGPKKWTEEGLEKLREKARKQSGDKNPFYGKTHTEMVKQQARERQLTNSWIKGIDPAELSYATWYEITYPSGETKTVAGLKTIAKEFGVSIANVHATVKRMTEGKMPTKSVFKNHIIRKIEV